MAKSTKSGAKRIWVAFRHPVNRTLSAQGFGDVLESSDAGVTWSVAESAEQRSEVLLRDNPSARVMAGAKTAEEALAQAQKEKM